nr:hypothetical protein [Tanacetum cinerariifolium]
MANQEQNPPQQEQPFVGAKQVGFNLEDIILNTNNEVALLYPEHNNKDHFKCVFDFISKCCLRKPFTKSLNMYKEYLAEFWYLAKALENYKVYFSTPTGGIYREVGVNTFRNAIGAHYLPHSSEYVAPQSIDILRPWFETIGYGEAVPTKRTQKRVFFLLGGEPTFTDHMLAICTANTLVVFKVPKPSSNSKRVPQDTKPRAKPGHKKHSSSKQSSVSSKEATKGGSFKAPNRNDASAVSTAKAHPVNLLLVIFIGNKMHKEFPLPVKVVATARRLEMPLPEVCTAIEEKKKKLPVKDRWQLH